MGGLKKWAAKGFSPQHQKHQKLRRLSQSACRVLGRLQGFQGFLRMFLGGCEKSVIQEMSPRFCIKVLNFVSVLAVGYFTSVSLCAVMQSCGVIPRPSFSRNFCRWFSGRGYSPKLKISADGKV